MPLAVSDLAGGQLSGNLAVADHFVERQDGLSSKVCGEGDGCYVGVTKEQKHDSITPRELGLPTTDNAYEHPGDRKECS